MIAVAAESYPTSRPQPGWAEQDPGDWLAALAKASRRLLEEAGPRTVDAVGLTSATHHAVLLDAAGAPLLPCILLSDGRASARATELEESQGELITSRTRNSPSAGWTLPQLQWLAAEEPGSWSKTRRIALAKDYLLWHLTGEWASDWIDAEGTLLVDSTTHSWDSELCRLAGIQPATLNPIVAPSAVVGTVTSSAAELTGLAPGTPVVAGSSDTSAEMLAAGATQPGQLVVKLATAGMVATVTPSAVARPGWFTYTYLVDGLDYQALGTNSAAEALRWFAELFPSAGYEALEAEAQLVPAGSEGVLFHPYLMGERSPVFDPELRAAFLGVGSGHGRGHLARAVLEGVSLSLLDCLEAMCQHLEVGSEAFVVGGGARSPLWRSILADVLGLELKLPALADASAGAALIAAAGIGQIELDGTAPWAKTVDRVSPDSQRHDGYAELLHIYRSTRDGLSDVGPSLRRVRYT